MNKLYFLFCLAALSCQKTGDIHDFTLYEYRKVADGYRYSDQWMIYNGHRYMLKTVQRFVNDTITEAHINKSEGLISYAKKELAADTALFALMNFSKSKRLAMTGHTLTDGGVQMPIAAKKSDSIFCLNNDTLFMYKINRE